MAEGQTLRTKKSANDTGFYLRHFDHDGVLGRREFFDEIYKLISIDKPFQLVMTRMVNQQAMNAHLGYIGTEKLIGESLEWLTRVVGKSAGHRHFNLAKIESATFAIVISGQLSKEELSILLRTLVGTSTEEAFKEILPPADVKFTVGHGLYPDSGRTVNELLSNTEKFLFRHEKIMLQTGESPLSISAFSFGDLAHAVRDEQFELWYQPKVDLINHKVIGVEALVRWRHPEHGVLLPPVFLNWFNALGLMGMLNRWIIDTGFKKCREFIDQDHDITVALNLDASSLTDETTVAAIEESRTKYQVPTNKIEFEIIETVEINKGDEKLAALNRLKAKGYQISIDDFGTGVSNISYLTFIPANTIKLDRLFSSNISDERTLALTKAAVQMAKVASVSVVAEGIETEEQSKAMASLGCDVGQGYFYGRPTLNFVL